MDQLFISYRRGDSKLFAESLHQSLSLKMGKKNVIFDQASIPPGVDFRDYLSRRIRDCDIVLAVIGPAWTDATKDGYKRLDQSDDPVLVELEVALQGNKHVVPILVDDTVMPVEKELPATIKTLAYKNAIRFRSSASFDTDLKKLLVAIQDYRLPKKTIRRLAWALTGFIVLSLVLAIATWQLWVMQAEANSMEGITANLSRYDKEIFSRHNNEAVKVARAFPNREALDKATSIKDQFLSAQQSFDLFVFSGKAIAESETAMTDAARRGVRVRIVMVDHSPENQANVVSYLSMIEHSGRPLEWYPDNYKSSVGILRRVRETVKQDSAAKGSVEVRKFIGPFASSFWVRDAGQGKQQAAHIAVTLYGDDRKFPSIRFGDLSSEVVENLASHFDYLWKKGRDTFSEQ